MQQAPKLTIQDQVQQQEQLQYIEPNQFMSTLPIQPMIATLSPAILSPLPVSKNDKEKYG